jgi:ribosomal protein S18 acetylase RimI-like enzyme
MPLVEIRPFHDADRADVVLLWERADLLRPWNDPNRDIDRKLTVQPHLFLVATVDDRVVGSVMAGYDGHRGWANYLAVDPEQRRRGIGRQLMAAATEGLAVLGCPKINVQVRGGNDEAVRFYEALGYRVDDVTSLGSRLQVDGPRPG